MLGAVPGTEIAEMLRSTGSTSDLLRAAVAVLDRCRPPRDVELIEDRQAPCCCAASRTRRGLARHLYMCDFTKGFLEQVPTFLGATGDDRRDRVPGQRWKALSLHRHLGADKPGDDLSSTDRFPGRGSTRQTGADLRRANEPMHPRRHGRAPTLDAEPGSGRPDERRR